MPIILIRAYTGHQSCGSQLKSLLMATVFRHLSSSLKTICI